ncbi:hypothetical protein [Oerskovia paurometabola]|uniref:Phage tail protein n=1 Tax=Oerskovia paurometabola TaxID=162170 RepID=A0ABW1XB60_9CELL|nr:hypothetical protein [Oerskovia paurometabola]MBM7497814.1 hypothetical protein [Oerskovia paurometabola]
MRAGPPQEVLSGTCGWAPVVSSWLGGRLLDADVPVRRGRVVAQVGQRVPERLTLTVPRFDGLRDMRPGDRVDHPLARYGQELQVSILVSSAVDTDTWETRIGRFLVTDWDDGDDGTITVIAAGRLRRVEDAKLTSPTQPGTGATLMSEARRLLPAGMSAAFAPGLADRLCPAAMAWSEDRLAALREIADAWPALLRTDEWGQVVFRRPLAAVPVPVLTLRDGERGALASAGRSDTREGAYNQVVARSSAAGVEDVQAIAQQTAGPLSVHGQYGPVTKIWSSPLVVTTEQALAAAQTMLASSILPATSVPVRCVPDPRIDLDDPVEIGRDGERVWGYVTGYDLPLTVTDGEMRVDVGVSM